MVYNRYKVTVLLALFKKIGQARGQFCTIHERPIGVENTNTWSDPLTTQPSVAIVIQGPLKLEMDFTLETVRLYVKNCPGAHIIVSTDATADPDTLQAIASAGAHIVYSERPTLPGWGNVNLQLASTITGMKSAKELGAEFVYKTRTDQRMYAVNMSEFLVNLIHAFPVTPGFQQQYRIIASSFLTLKYVPYLITDMFQFGQIDDMLNFWSAPHDTRTGSAPITRTVQEATDARIAESYLVTEYLKRIGYTPQGTLSDSWQVYANHFCIVDRETLDLFWYKYNFYQEYANRNYHGVSNSQLLTFAEWFNLYTNHANKKVPTTGLQLTRQDCIPKPTTV